MKTLDSFNLQQHVNIPTHIKGHTLDLIITKSQETTISNITSHPALMSDHSPLTSTLHTLKPPLEKEKVTFRKTKNIDATEFSKDIDASTLITNPEKDLHKLVDQYNSTLTNILDRHAPETTKEIQVRARPAWFDNSILQAKRTKRRAERQFLSTKLEVHRQILIKERENLNQRCKDAKKEYYIGKIKENDGNQKEMYAITNHLLGKKKTTQIPTSHDPKETANNFASFFKEKIENIKKSFSHVTPPAHNQPNNIASHLNHLTPVTQEKIKKTITSGNSKSCILDPIPTALLKSCLDSLLPAITAIVNSSLESSTFPDQYKTASVTPILKKPSLDENEPSNYRPVSNLPYLGKIIEKIVVEQLTTHMTTNNLHQPLQSAYRKHHSTETAIVKIMNDLLMALDSNQCVLLIMLDLSAAFDTVDHELLLTRLEQSFGIQDGAKAWLRSYFSDRQQVVRIKGVASDPQALTTGMPQGSVLGPFSFPQYTSPLFNIANNNQCQIHMYADDTQLYMSFNIQNSENTIAKMEECIRDTKKWMAENFLKLNDSKTEFLIICKKSFLPKISNIGSIRVGDTKIKARPDACNIGCFIDTTLNMEAQINHITRCCYASLHQISRIRNNLNEDAAACLVNALVTSRLDSFNAILYGLPEIQLDRLQLVQNSAARMITRNRNSNTITILKKLHWLPIRSRINYKIVILCFKALNNLAPIYISDLLNPYKKDRPLRSATQAYLDIPKTNLKSAGDRSFCAVAPRLWNKLPETLRKITSLDTFKKELKTHYFKIAFKC